MRSLVKGSGDMAMGCIWSLCNITLESGVVHEDWGSAVIVLLYKGKWEKIECRNYRGISLLSVAGKIFAGILADRV